MTYETLQVCHIGGICEKKVNIMRTGHQGGGKVGGFTASLPLIYLGNRHEAREIDRRKHLHVIVHAR